MLSIINILFSLLTISSLVTGTRCDPRQLSYTGTASVTSTNGSFRVSSGSPSTSIIVESCDSLDCSSLDKPAYLSHFLALPTLITSAKRRGNVSLKATITCSTITMQSSSSSGLVSSPSLAIGVISSSVIYPNFTISSNPVASNAQSSSSLSPADTGQSDSSLISILTTPLSSSAASSSSGSSNLLSLTNSGQFTSTLSSILNVTPSSSQAETSTAGSNPRALTSITQTSSVLQNPIFTQLTVVVPSVTTTFTTTASIATQTPDITSASSGSSLLSTLSTIVVGLVVGAAVLVGLFEV